METGVTIEVDRHTAEVLQRRAAALGITVPQLLAELATLEGEAREASPEEIAELDRRWARAAEGERVSHRDVVRWLRTWGTSQFRPWQSR